MELAWRNGIMSFAMSYMVQFTREYTKKVDDLAATLAKEREDRKKKRPPQPRPRPPLPRAMLRRVDDVPAGVGLHLPARIGLH